MSLDGRFAVLYIGPDKLGLIKAQGSKGNISLTGEEYQNYDGYNSAGFVGNAKEIFLQLLNKVHNYDRLIIGIPQEFCIQEMGYAALRLPQAVQVSREHIEELLSNFNKTLQGYPCTKKKLIRFYEANGIPVQSPIGLIAKELYADISATFVKQEVLDFLEGLEVGIPVNYIGNLNAITYAFTEDDTSANDNLLIFIGFAETSVAIVKSQGISSAMHFSLGCADLICDFIKVLNIGYRHASTLFDVLDLSIKPSKEDKYSIEIDDTRFEYSIEKVNAIAFARISQIFDWCLEAMLKIGYNGKHIYLICRGFAQDRGLGAVAEEKLGKDIVFAANKAVLFKDRPEEEGLLKYLESILPSPDKPQARGNALISIIRRIKIGRKK